MKLVLQSIWNEKTRGYLTTKSLQKIPSGSILLTFLTLLIASQPSQIKETSWKKSSGKGRVASCFLLSVVAS